MHNIHINSGFDAASKYLLMAIFLWGGLQTIGATSTTGEEFPKLLHTTTDHSPQALFTAFGFMASPFATPALRPSYGSATKAGLTVAEGDIFDLNAPSLIINPVELVSGNSITLPAKEDGLAAIISGEEGIIFQDMRGVECFAQPDEIVICGTPDTISILLFTKSEAPIFDAELSLSFQNGLEYAGFAYVSSGNADLDTLNVDNSGSPSFRLDEISQATGAVTVYLGVRASCDYDLAVVNPNVTFELDYVSGGLACTSTLTPEVPYGSDVLLPEVVFGNFVSGTTLGIANAEDEFCKSVNLTQTTAGASAFGAVATISTDYLASGITLTGVEVSGVSVPASDIVDNLDGTLTVTIDGETNAGYFGADGLTSGENDLLTFCFDGPEECFANISLDLTVVFACEGELCGPGQPAEVTFTLANTFDFNSVWTIDNIQELSTPLACNAAGETSNFVVQFDLNNTDGNYMGDLTSLVISIDSCFGLSPDTFYLGGANPGPLPANITTDGRTTLTFNNAITTDPDGVGVGLEDLDGDGSFDDLAGDQSITVVMEFTAEVDMTACGQAVPVVCDFNKIIVSGRVDCNQDPMTYEADFGPNSFASGSTLGVGRDTTTFNRDGTDFNGAYDFGQVGNVGGTPTAITKTVELDYSLDPTDIIACANVANRYIQATFTSEGKRILTENFELPTISSANATLVSTEVNGISVTWRLKIDEINETLDDLIVEFDLTLDTAICSPPLFGSLEFFIIDECVDCADLEIIRVCGRADVRADPEDDNCSPCNAEVYTELSRVSTGYTDRDLATRLTTEETLDRGISPVTGATADALTDTLRVLPGDTVAISVNLVVDDASLYNDAALLAINLNMPFNDRAQFWDLVAARVYNFSVSRADGSQINLGSASDVNGGTTNYLMGNSLSNGSNAFSSNTQLHPGIQHDSWQFRRRSSTSDRFRDGNDLKFQIVDNPSSPSGHMDEIYEAIGGEFLPGDTINLTWWVPIIRIPRESGYDDGFIPNSNYSVNFSDLNISVASQERNETTGDLDDNRVVTVEDVCENRAVLKFYEPTPGVAAEIEYSDDNGEGCDAEIVLDFFIDDFGDLQIDGAYPNEYRPILGLEQFTADIPSSFFLESDQATFEFFNASSTLSSGTLNFDATTSDVVNTQGSTFFVSGSSTTQVTFTDLELEDGTNWTGYLNEFTAPIDVTQVGGELPLLGVGSDAYDTPDTLRIRIPLKRICPVDPPGNLEVQAVLSYPYLPDYRVSPFLCSNNGNSWFNNPLGSNCGDSFSFNILRGSDASPHRFLETAVYDNINTPLAYVAPTTSIDSPTLTADAAGTETNTFNFTPNSDLGQGFFLIEVPSSVSLISVNGGADPFTVLSTGAGTTTYEVDMGVLMSGVDRNFVIETDLLFCDPAEINLKVLTGCVSTDEMVKAVAAAAGVSCPGPSATYSYLAGEVTVDASISYEADQEGCGERPYTLEFTNTGTSVLLGFAPVVYLQEGLTVTPGSFMVTTSNPALGPVSIDEPTEDVSLSGVNGLAFNWPAAYFDDAAFGTDMIEVGETVTVTFMAAAQCEFTAGLPVSFELTGTNICDEPFANELVTGPGINPVPASTPTPEFNIALSDVRLFCGESADPITITVLNSSKVDAGQTEICLTLPPGVTLTADDITVVAPMGYAPVLGAPDPVGAAGATQLCFAGPDALEVGGFLCFEIMPDVSLLDCGFYDFGIGITAPVSFSCSGMVCGAVDVLAASETISLEVVPALGLAEATVSVSCGATEGTLDLTFDVDLENLSIADYNDNIEFTLYTDFNGDGLIDDFETVIVGPSTVAAAIDAEGMTTLQPMFNVPTNSACPFLLQINIPGCVCGEYVVPFDEVVPAVVMELGDFLVLCPGENYPLEADLCGDLTFAFDPVAAGEIITDDVSGTVEISLNDGFGVDAPVTLNVISSIGSCGEQTFPIRIEQLETFEFDDVVVDLCQEGCQTVDLGIPFILQADLEISITPAIYLTDATSFQPEICDPATDITYVSRPEIG